MQVFQTNETMLLPNIFHKLQPLQRGLAFDSVGISSNELVQLAESMDLDALYGGDIFFVSIYLC